MNPINSIMLAAVSGVISLLIVNAVIAAGNFSGIEATLLSLVPLVLVAVVLYISMQGLGI